MIGLGLSCARRSAHLRILLVISLSLISACSWFGAGRHRAPEPAEIVVTGAPAGALLLVDGAQIGDAALGNGHSQVIDVPPGSHRVEVKVGDRIVYREETDVAMGEHRIVTVLSGAPR